MEAKIFKIEMDVEKNGKLYIEGVAKKVDGRLRIKIEFAEYSGGPQLKHLLNSYGNTKKITSKVVSMFNDDNNSNKAA